MEIQRDLLIKNFLIESTEGLGRMEEWILELESHPGDSERIQSIFRVVHTMKGNAGLLGMENLQAFTHAVEDHLDTIRGGSVSFTAEIVSLLLELVDVLRQMVADACEGRDQIGSPAKDTLARISRYLSSDANATKAKDVAMNVKDVAVNVAEAPTSPSADADAAAGDWQKEVPRTLRVDLEKLDRLLNLAGEITIARGRVAQMLEAKDKINVPAIRDALSFADTLHFELQEAILKARMVRLGPLFNRHNRTVRDLAKSLGKTALLRIEGEDIEVDTAVAEHLKDPLLHMVRNALDHGIEPPAVRKAKGKPPAGTIMIRAAREGSNILIEVSDDGAGLDRQKIVEAANKKGLTGESDKLPDQDVDQLIFESGLTTASQISDVSGRGVGMDVVRHNVQALRGSVQVASRPGLGATVRIRLPLTLAIIEGLGVGVGDETYVIPVDQVVECFELPPEENDAARKEGVLLLRNEPLPFLHLKDHFGLPGERGKRQSVVVVQHDTKRAGLAVNALYGATQTVIKPLPAIFKNIPGVSGSAILGDGRVALILDIAELFRSVRLQAATQAKFQLPRPELTPMSVER